MIQLLLTTISIDNKKNREFFFAKIISLYVYFIKGLTEIITLKVNLSVQLKILQFRIRCLKESEVPGAQTRHRGTYIDVV